MSLCISTSAVSGSLSEKLSAISRAGFKKIDLTDTDLASFDGDAHAINRLIDEHGLSVNALHAIENVEGYTHSMREQAFARFEKRIETVLALRGSTLVVNASADHSTSTDSENIIDDLSKMAELAEHHNIRIAYLAHPWANYVTTNERAHKLVTSTDSPNLGLAINSCLILADGTKAAKAHSYTDKIIHVVLTDTQRQITSFDDGFRSSLLPGQGRLNIAALIRVLVSAGYKGEWSISGVRHAIPAGDPLHLARDAYRSLVNLLDEVQRTEPLAHFDVTDMPPRVNTTGFEFIEFAVDDETRPQLTSVLKSLGFSAERQHVSKAVELWRQGAVNILLNSESTGFARESFTHYGPGVCDMAIRVKDAIATVDRATALGTPEFSQAVAVGELNIPAIKGVGGNVVHFIDERSDLHLLWNIEFKRNTHSLRNKTTGIRRIDHVAQTTRYEQMQRFVLYYTTTFEMHKANVVDLADPAGMVRSQAIASPEGEVRLTLNGVIDDETLGGSFLENGVGAGVQHIAFATDNIFETSQLLDVAKFNRLRIPQNYYTTLQSEYGLEPDYVDRLKEHNILYCREESGEFFQIYSQTLFNGLFFEIVQRKDGYQGYGASNSTIRLNAQMETMKQGVA